MSELRSLALSPAVCVVTIAGRPHVLPQSSVVQVALSTDIHALPWCPATMAGVVSTEYGPLPVVELPDTPPDPAREHPYAVVLRTSKGLLAIRAEAVENRDEPGPTTTASHDLLPQLEQLTAAFAPAAPAKDQPAPGQLAPSPVTPYLKVRSGSKEALIAARALRSLDKHLGVQRFAPDDKLHWVVQLPDQLVLARSLAALRQLGGDAPSEPWCVLPERTSDPALLVGEVLGLVDVCKAHVHSLQCDGIRKQWWMRPDAEPLEILELGSAQQAHASSGMADLPAPAQPAVPPHAARSGSASADPGVLRLLAGPWSLVLPVSAVRRVWSAAEELQARPKRQKSAVRLLDLRRLFNASGAEESPPSPNAMWVQIVAGHSQVMLCADQVVRVGDGDRPADAAPWSSPPLLPQALHALVQAIRITDGRCEMLMQAPSPKRLREPFVRAQLKASFAGWYTPADSPDTL